MFKRMNLSSRLLLELMAARWTAKYGWRRGLNSIAELMGRSNSTASDAVTQLLELGYIYEVEPGRGRKAAVYDFGPNKPDLLNDEGGGNQPRTAEPLHPAEPDTNQTPLYPAERDTNGRGKTTLNRMQNHPLYPAEPDAFIHTTREGEIFHPLDEGEGVDFETPPYDRGADPYANWEPDPDPYWEPDSD